MSIGLSSLTAALERLAPLALAEEWDNVGLLVDPRSAGSELEVERVLLTIDATPGVIAEAVTLGANCLVAYHPPIFRAEKRFSRPKNPALFAAAQHGFAVYSPHTALDAAAQGLNDWLAEGLGPGTTQPLTPSRSAGAAEFKVVVFVPHAQVDALRDALAAAGAGVIGNYSHCSFTLDGEGSFFGNADSTPQLGSAERLERVPEIRLEMLCAAGALPAVAAAIRRVHPYEEPAWDVYPLAAKPLPSAGSGRLVRLATPTSLDVLLDRIKQHLGLAQLRLAASDAQRAGAQIRSVALCAGSGGSVFEREREADLYLTGELGHHQILATLARGQSVVLCNHTHTERGYLPRLRERLLELTAQRIEVHISKADREPLEIV